MNSRFVFLAFSLMFMCTPADAGFYKCTDAKGKITFKDRPCAKGKQEVLKNISSKSPTAPTSTGSTKSKSGQVEGKIYGEDFTFSKGIIFTLAGNYIFEIKQGWQFLPDKELTVFLRVDENENLVGKRYNFPDSKRRQQPKLTLIWNTSDGKRRQKDIESGYKMALEFGHIEDGILNGRITVALPNKNDLYLNGKFTLKVDF